MNTKPSQSESIQNRVNGTIARVAIQCTCPETGRTGSFLFTGESHRSIGSRVSPVFPDLVELFNWTADKANGWQQAVAGNSGLGFLRHNS